MFTGLIEKVGTVRYKQPKGKMYELAVSVNPVWPDIVLGESIAVNGVCLTVTRLLDDGFAVDVSLPTLESSNIKALRIGQKLNLERALRVGDRLGGHWVQGHVDGTGILKKINKTAENIFVTIELPANIAEEVILKGSIAVDGVSLTIQELTKTSLTVVIIPHTFQNTTFCVLHVDDTVNLEVDLISKYVKRHLANSAKKPLNLEYLREMGF
jgi:riboflavin synthase